MRRIAALVIAALLAAPAAHVQAAGLPLAVAVTPNRMPYNAHPSVVATTSAGAACIAHVRYSTGRRPVSFHAIRVRSTGRAVWSWHEMTKGKSGVATVTCALGGRTATASASFIVTH